MLEADQSPKVSPARSKPLLLRGTNGWKCIRSRLFHGIGTEIMGNAVGANMPKQSKTFSCSVIINNRNLKELKGLLRVACERGLCDFADGSDKLSNTPNQREFTAKHRNERSSVELGQEPAPLRLIQD